MATVTKTFGRKTLDVVGGQKKAADLLHQAMKGAGVPLGAKERVVDTRAVLGSRSGHDGLPSALKVDLFDFDGSAAVARRAGKIVGNAPLPEDSAGRETELQTRADAIVDAGRLPDREVVGLEPRDFRVLVPSFAQSPEIPLETPAERITVAERALIQSPKDLADLAAKGISLLTNNTAVPGLGTAAQATLPAGASSRARNALHDALTKGSPDEKATARAALYELGLGDDIDTPRFLYRLAGTTMFTRTLEARRMIARELNVVFPTVIMSGAETAERVAGTAQVELAHWEELEQASTFWFNQGSFARFWLDTLERVGQESFPNGHGDFVLRMALYQLFQGLAASGIKYFIFGNTDEYLWGADPVMIALAQRAFDNGYPILALAVKNTNNQFGGGFVRRLSDDSAALVETPRLPQAMNARKLAPKSINTTFYIISVDYMARVAERLISFPSTLTIKKLEGRRIVGSETWAGDIFTSAEVLAGTKGMLPIWVARTWFNGLKEFLHLTGDVRIPEYAGLSMREYHQAAVYKQPMVMEAILSGNRDVFSQLFANGYSYVGVNI